MDTQKRFLIVDDSRLVRKQVVKHLTNLGFSEFIEACDGQDALDKYQSQKPDMIFMDIVMPNATGLDALREIRKTDHATPIVMLSSVNEDSLINECKELGIKGFIDKPITQDNGQEKLGQFLMH